MIATGLLVLYLVGFFYIILLGSLDKEYPYWMWVITAAIWPLLIPVSLYLQRKDEG